MKLISPLTEKQKECEAYMRQFRQKYNKIPTTSNVAKALGISRTSAYKRIRQVIIKTHKNNTEMSNKKIRVDNCKDCPLFDYQDEMMTAECKGSERVLFVGDLEFTKERVHDNCPLKTTSILITL